MTCHVAMERLLEAEPAELRGRAGTELSRHVAECARCGRVAARLASELATLEEALAGYAAAGDADAAADRALEGIEHRESRIEDRGSRIENRGSRIEHRESRFPRRYWRRGIGVSIAAAAGLAALLLLDRGGETPGAPAGIPTPEPAKRVAVTAPSDRGMAVLETEDPKITIVWLYEREES